MSNPVPGSANGKRLFVSFKADATDGNTAVAFARLDNFRVAVNESSGGNHPAVVVDAHEYTVVGRFLQKFNAIQRFDALLQYTTTANTHEFITKAAEEWYRRPVLAALAGQQLTSEAGMRAQLARRDTQHRIGTVAHDHIVRATGFARERGRLGLVIALVIDGQRNPVITK